MIGIAERILRPATWGAIALLFVFGCTPQTFQRTYGGSGEQTAFAVAEAHDHGYVMAGSGTGPTIYLVKTMANGDLEWQTSAYTGSFGTAWAVLATSDGGYVAGGGIIAGTAPTGGWVVKLDAAGQLEWQHEYPNAIEVDAILETADGGFVLAGTSGVGGTTEYDTYLAKISGTGELVWEKTFGASGRDWGYSLAATSDGGFILGGITNTAAAGLFRIDADGNLVWRRGYSPIDAFGWRNYFKGVRERPDGSFIAAGYFQDTASKRQSWVIATDSAGARLWEKTLASAGNSELTSIVPAWGGGYVIAGYKDIAGDKNLDAYLARIDDAGTIGWERTYGATGEDKAASVQAASDGGYVFAGSTTSFGTSGRDFYLVKTDAEGNAPATP